MGLHDYEGARSRGLSRRRPARWYHWLLLLLGVIALSIAAGVIVSNTGRADTAPDVGRVGSFGSTDSTAAPIAQPTTDPTPEIAADSASATTPPGPPEEPAISVSTHQATLPSVAEDTDAAEPTRLAIASLNLDAEIVPVGVDPGGQMEIPARGDQIGWYRFGPTPGAEQGTVVLASHITTADGWGVLAGLADLESGDRIVVSIDEGAELGYTVTSRWVEAKADLDTAALFDRTSEPRIVLVTCTGPWVAERGAHRDNLIVAAIPDAG